MEAGRQNVFGVPRPNRRFDIASREMRRAARVLTNAEFAQYHRDGYVTARFRFDHEVA